MAERRSKLVHRVAVVTLGATFALIIAGALVTSRDAGLAVPDWPLAYGELNPPRWFQIVNVRTEHSHRIIAATVAVSTTLLACLILTAESRRWVRGLGLAAVGLVLLQALIGGLRVLNLSLDLAMVHGWTAQAFLSVLVILTTVTGPAWSTVRERVSAPLLRASCALTLLLLLQLASGILIRHLGAEARPLLGNALFYLHLGLAAGILGLALRLGAGGELDGPARRPARLLAPLATVQVALGLASFVITETMQYDRQATLAESWLPTAHVAAGAALLAASIALSTYLLAAPTGTAAAAEGTLG